MMRRKTLSLIFRTAYRHPLIFKIGNALLFGKKMRVWRKLARLTVPDNGVLEIGCGMNPATEEGVALDYSLSLLKEVRDWERAKKVCASALSLPFASGSFRYVLSVFPPGISADEGFFIEPRFWKELRRVLKSGGFYVALVYVEYRSALMRVLAKIIDPLPADFWKWVKAAANGFEMGGFWEPDVWGNRLLFVKAQRLQASPDPETREILRKDMLHSPLGG